MPGRDAPSGARRLLAVALVVGCFGACRGDSGEKEDGPLEAVDVAPALEIATADDPTARERPPALVGVLPASFPGDLPLYLPASLVDWGSGEGGRYVSLLSPHGLARVERELAAKVRDSGWSATGSGGVRVLRKGGRQVRLRIEDGKPGTLYRFEY